MAFLVYLKHKNGTTYVYENVPYWDKNYRQKEQIVKEREEGRVHHVRQKDMRAR